MNFNENKHLRIIANPYLLRKNINLDIITKEHNELLHCLSKKYNEISYNDIEEIIILIDEYFKDKCIKDFVNSIIEDVINEI